MVAHWTVGVSGSSGVSTFIEILGAKSQVSPNLAAVLISVS